SGQIKPGQMLATMGASGAGKTTLLNVLTARNLRLVEVEGTVKLNDREADLDSIKAFSAYVQQDDLFLGTLTVREHLKFQAMLRMEKHYTRAERKVRVESVMQELGLNKCADNLIGYPGRIKGISGGERKRLAFASEVLTNPSIFICDEPTSGLDSYMAEQVIQVLHSMAQAGRTIMCTIHQPSSEVFALFNQLLLLADGRVAYMGDVNSAIDFFSSLGHKCPSNFNPADFFIQKLAIVPGNETDCRKKVNAICDTYANSNYYKETMPREEQYPRAGSTFSSPQRRKLVYKATWFRQFYEVYKRATINIKREPIITVVRSFQTILVAVILGLIFLDLKVDQRGITNINGALFLILMTMTFQNTFSAITTFCMELPIFLREHHNAIYRVSSYFWAKTMAELPVFIILPIVFVAIFYWMVELNPGFNVFCANVLIAILVANCACSFGYLVSCVSNNMTIALSIAPPILGPLVIFGGYFLKNTSVPVYFIWLKYLSWFHFANEAAVVNQWQNIRNISCAGSDNPTIFTHVNSSSSYEADYDDIGCIRTGNQVILSFEYQKDNYYRDIGLLFVLVIGYRIAAFIALCVKARNKA
ncbi:protein white-like isoform X1, partial [Leptotrombidium deliense]